MKKITLLITILIFTIGFSQDFRDNVQLIDTPNLTDTNADFGYAAKIFNNKIVIGARGEIANASTQEPGAVYVYEKQTTSNWVQLNRFSINDGLTGDDFGYAVDIYNNTIVAGARKYDTNSVTDSGAVYVYEIGNNGIVDEQTLVSPQIRLFNWFGSSVSVSDSYIVIGEPFYTNNANNQGGAGAVHIFKKDSNGDWIFDHTLISPNQLDGNEFGNAVKIYNNKIIIGAQKEGATNRGRAYIYQLNNITENFDYVQTLDISSQQTNTQYGFSVDINEEYAIVGALGLNKAYLFELDSSNGIWNLNNSLDNLLTITGGTGASVSLFDNYAVVGSPSYTGGGAATVFKRNNSSNQWELLQSLLPAQENITSTQTSINFGRAVSMYNQNILVGAYNGNSEQTPTYESGLVALYETNTTLGIDEQYSQKPIEFYPNPVKDYFFINTNYAFDDVRLYDIHGKIVNTFKRTYAYNISNLESGIYFVSLSNNIENLLTLKLIKE